MRTLAWTTRYDEFSHATEEVISDAVRKAQWAVIAGWFAILAALFWVEYLQEIPSVPSFLRNAAIATASIAIIYGMMVGLRYFAHARPHQWHFLNIGVIYAFLAGITGYFAFTEGVSSTTVASGAVLVCVLAYHWLMHRSKVQYTITPQGVSQHISFLGYSQTHYTRWTEVRKHRVHPLSGAVELTLRWHGFHIKPRAHLIVPDKKHRKQVHDVLARILWPKKTRHAA
ncbi:MAG: hypothetical protein AABY13_02625 [Nanoarchaeota archaeon]